MDRQKRFIPFVCISLIAFSATTATPAFAVDLAKVNGKVITEKDLQAAMGAMTPGQRDGVLRDAHARKQLLDQVIDQELLIQEAEKEKVDQSQEYKDALAAFRREYLANRVLTKNLNSRLTEDSAKKFYKNNKTRYTTDRVHAMHILVKDEKEARDLIAKAKAPGADFQALAEKYSVDPSAKNNRGDLGFFGRGVMVPEFTDAAFAGRDGEVLDRPVKTAFGYHVIKVIEHRTGKTLSYADVESNVKSQLRQDLTANYLTQLREQSKVSVDDQALNKL